MSTPASLQPLSADDHESPQTSSPKWREELLARVREHRQRRTGAPGPGEPSERQPRVRMSPAASVAERVAARYSKAPSYQELLAAAAAVAAETAAEAALEAHAAAQAVLSGWEQARESAALPHGEHEDELECELLASAEPSFFAEEKPALSGEPMPPLNTAASVGAAPRVEHPVPLPERTALPERAPVVTRARALVDAFAEAVVPAAQSLPAKLIEFPRELIATRRERPRLAEGPLCDNDEESSGVSLRIFEVEAEFGSDRDERVPSAVAGVEDSAVQVAESDVPAYRIPEAQEQGSMPRRDEHEAEEPEPRRRGGFQVGHEQQPPTPVKSGWGTIQLGEHPRAESPVPEPAVGRARAAARPAARADYREESAPLLEDQAPLTDRCMAALVDFGLIFACFLLSVLVFASCTVHPPMGKAAFAGALFALGVLAAFYGWLFMTWGGGSTPGMRYARIALCTFNDENPTRKDLQNRIPATALALLPLGLGVLWTLLDEDRLGWHDRMTRTYQRSYR